MERSSVTRGWISGLPEKSKLVRKNKMTPLRLIVLLVWLLLLVACSGQQIRPDVQNPEQVWRTQQQILQGLTSWDLRGRIAISTENDGFNANFLWHQWGENYHIQLNGPFGIGALTLAGDQSGVAFRRRGETTFHRGNAEMLFFQQTGVQLPITSLRYWVRGIPQQGVHAKVLLDRQGRLKELQQSGWRIHYKRYSHYRGIDLPAKVFMDNQQLKVRLVIERWVLT